MARGKDISKEEIIKVLDLKLKGKTPKEISKILKRSIKSVYRILHNGDKWSSKKRPGRQRITSKRDDRIILSMASRKNISLRKIASKFGVSKNTIHRRILESKRITFKKMLKKPCLKKHHKTVRLNWAKKMMSYGDKWLSTIFSDEKKWNLDGPDGYKFYWHDLRSEPRSFFSRQQGGGSVMTWGGFGFNGQTSLAICSKKMNSQDCQQILEDHFLPLQDLLGGPSCVFQQDRAPIHMSNSTKMWFNMHNINVMDWPSLSPDLNPMENVWGHLARKVYANGRQYFSTKDLTTAIEQAWYELSPEVMQNLVLSMENRVFEVIKGNGNTIKY